MRWYIVLTPYRNPGVHQHLGLQGETWPLDPELTSATAERADDRWSLVWVAGCSFEVCIDNAYARSYFELAREYIPDLRLIEVSPLTTSTEPHDGIDIGRPSGGFSAAGEVCANAHLFERYGNLLNDKGLFGSVELFEQYMKMREGRETLDGVEYLDESMAVFVRVLCVKP